MMLVGYETDLPIFYKMCCKMLVSPTFSSEMKDTLFERIPLTVSVKPLIMKFWREFLTAGRPGNYFLFSIWITICHNMTCKNSENRSKMNVVLDKTNFE